MSKKFIQLIVILLIFKCINAYAIKPYSDNNYYWELNGNPVVLLGGSWQDNPWQWAGSYNKSILIDQLDTMVNVGANYIRNTMSQRNVAYSGSPEYWDVGMAYPFVKSGGKYDLNQWNNECWTRLNNFLYETSQRGIIVQLEIWDRWSVVGSYSWSFSPWNGYNNVNYNGSTVYSNTFFESVPSMYNNTTVMYYQNRYIDKMLSIALNYDNVIYQINNESEFDFKISDYWANYIDAKASDKGKTVYVCDSRRYHAPSYTSLNFQLPDHSENIYPLQNFSRYKFLDISQNGGNSGQIQYENLIWYRGQVQNYKIRPINHIKTYKMNWPIGKSYNDRRAGTDWSGTAKLWRSIFGGAAGVRFHRDTIDQSGDFWFGLGLTSLAQTHITSTRILLDEIFIFKMQPNNSLLSFRENDEAYCLAEIGKQYAVYFTREGNRSVNIDLASGDYQLKWLNIGSSSLSTPESIHGGVKTLTAPSYDQWVAIITNGNGKPKPAPGGCVLNSKFQTSTIRVGEDYYTDRSYTITGGIPSWMVGRNMIRTPNDERLNKASSGYLRFSNPVDWYVYVLFDSRASNVPDWLDKGGWERKSEYRVYSSLSSQPYLQVWKKRFPAGGCVDLGGNYGPGSSTENRSNFIVVYGKSTTKPPAGCVLNSKFQTSTIRVGEDYYTDRSYTITGGIPSWMVGRNMIRTPNDERLNNASSGYLRFSNPVDWYVYVLFDSRASNVPDWLDRGGWERKSEYSVYSSLSSQPYLQVWKKRFPAGGCVDLGGNYGPGSSTENRSNFVVVYGK